MRGDYVVGVLSGDRASKSNEEARRAQLERIRAMTPFERMALALALGRRRKLVDSKHSKPGADERR